VDRETTEVLRGASLHVAAGEFVCLLGPSGSGKSSILNLVAGLTRPSSGRVLRWGAPVAGPGPDRALVFQDAALFPWLTLEANVEFPLKLQGLSAVERAGRVEELLRLVHLWSFRGRYPHELSGGMRQRGAIARAVARSGAASEFFGIGRASRTLRGPLADVGPGCRVCGVLCLLFVVLCAVCDKDAGDPAVNDRGRRPRSWLRWFREDAFLGSQTRRPRNRAPAFC
jgi:hypothetical protein